MTYPEACRVPDTTINKKGNVPAASIAVHSTTPARILVIGASGKIGRLLVPKLIAENHSVIAGIRDQIKAAWAPSAKESTSSFSPLDLAAKPARTKP